MTDQVEIHRKVRSEDVRERIEAVFDCSYNIDFITDKQQVGEDMHQLAHDNESNVRILVVGAIPGIIPHVPNKNQAWEDLIRLTSDTESDVRRGAAYALGSAFSHVPDKKQVSEDLNRLTYDSDSDVRSSAYHSLGKASIFKAANTENDVDFKKEMEIAIGFFEQSSKQETDSKPAKFCLPFYRSFYSLTFHKEEEEAVVKKYIAEAKRAIEGSESKEKLLEAVENLGNALKEVQKPRDFNDMKSDLNAYRRYCDRACELLDTTEEKAPGASRLIRRGLPIIDERIRGIIAEIQGKAKALYKNTKGTKYESLGKEVVNAGESLLKVRDPIGLEKAVGNLEIAVSAMCKKMPAEEKGDACELLKKANEEEFVEDKINLLNMAISQMSSQMNKNKDSGNIEIHDSENVQVVVGEKNHPEIKVNNHIEKPNRKKLNLLGIITNPATVAAFAGFIAIEIGTVIYPIKYGHQISVGIALIVFFIALFIERQKA